MDAEFGRTGTILKTLGELKKINVKTIVEIGAIGDVNDRIGDGHGTMAWGVYASKFGGTVYTVDIEQIKL